MLLGQPFDAKRAAEFGLVTRVIPDETLLATATETAQHTYRLLLPDGRIKHVHALAHVVHDACGNREFVGTGIDVTERKRAEQTLRQSEAYLVEAQRLSQTGTLRIRLRTRHSQNGSALRITVADNGVGIPVEQQKRIFEPFFTTKQETGTGLGLWLTKNIMEKHGGTTRVSSSSIGKTGTVFILTLPQGDLGCVGIPYRRARPQGGFVETYARCEEIVYRAS